MGIEIERKFLVKHDIWQQQAKPAGTVMRQGYVVNETGKTIRLRITDTKAYITFKSGTQGISRAEFEYEIPVADATELFDLFVESGIEKTRYNITYQDKIWEVDVFSGDNQGLIVAEIELDTENEKFELPPWAGPEVSDDEHYYNSSLSVTPFQKW
ncbi:CYTH domain-containing protein [Mucilaginibacter antarcticus]|uniref:CYTH domain-containing protein n=1 Tax=Mucilaginibacter antarcticus TaxID=1855725 RepID=A0ABW5XM69_9SPHI